jgi:hypothetical protein
MIQNADPQKVVFTTLKKWFLTLKKWFLAFFFAQISVSPGRRKQV